MAQNTRVLAIDPGYGRVGIAILERSSGKERLVFSECFETTKDKLYAQRLSALREHLGVVCDRYTPQVLAIESLYFSKNKKTALGVAEARGVIVAETSLRGIPLFEYNPAQIKIAVTGHGKSDKRQVMEMVHRLLKLPKEIERDDEYDAIAIGLTYFATNPR